MSLPETLYAVVTKGELRSTQSAGKFYKMEVRTQAGQWNANIWDVKDNDEFPKKGDAVKINKFKDQTETKHANIALKLNDLDKIQREEIPEEHQDVIFAVPKAKKEDIDKAWATIIYDKFYEDPKNLEFVKKCYAEYSTEDILKWPAAVGIHHHYQGGYVVHVAEVMKHAKNMIQSTKSNYNLISNDVVMVAAALHDIGKLETYYLDKLGISQKYVTESSISHFFYSMELVNKIGKKEKLDKVFLEEVLHCIASHHGRIEYGSVTPVMTLEALIVSMADNLSSKCGMIDTKIREIKEAGGKMSDIDFLRARNERYIKTKAMERFCESLDKNT